MSSPRVITATQVPLEVAIASNREDIAYYLEMAREALNQIEAVERKTLAAGSPLMHRDVIPFEQAEAEAWRRFRQDGNGGYTGTEYAHAYWQSIKHPWQEQVVRHYSAAAAEQARQQREERQRIEEIAARIRPEFRTEQEFTLQEIDASDCKPVFSLQQQITAAKSAILQAVDAANKVAIEAQILQCEGQDLQRQCIALEALRLTVEQEAKQRRMEEGVRIYQENQRQLIAERMEWHLRRCVKRLEELETAQSTQLQTEVEQIASDMRGGSISLEGEDRLQELERRITEAARQQGLLEAAITSLRRQGYEKIEVGQVIGPPPIDSVYLHDPRDHNRVALVQACEEKGLLSAEIVRRSDTDGSQQERARDQEAQERLCRAMDAAQQALAEKWHCSVLKNEKPGVPPKVKTNIAPRKSAAGTQRKELQRTIG